MRVTKLRLQPGSSPMIYLPVVDVDPDARFLLKSVTGLGPTDIDISLADTLYQYARPAGMSPTLREVVIHITLQPDYAAGEVPGDLRDELYRMISNGTGNSNALTIIGENDVSIGGLGGCYVKRFEINPFSKDPEVQITLQSMTPYITAFTSTSMLPIVKKANNFWDHVNEGTATSGLIGKLTFTADHGAGWTLSRTTLGVGANMFFDYPFETGDILEFDTRPGSKGVWVTRNSVKTNIIWCLSSTSVWLEVSGGKNTFYTSTQSYDWNSLYYTRAWVGV